MEKRKVRRMRKKGKWICGEMFCMDMHIFFRYHLKTGIVHWFGVDEEEGHIDARILSDKYGIDYCSTGNTFAALCCEYAAKNGYLEEVRP